MIAKVEPDSGQKFLKSQKAFFLPEPIRSAMMFGTDSIGPSLNGVGPWKVNRNTEKLVQMKKEHKPNKKHNKTWLSKIQYNLHILLVIVAGHRPENIAKIDQTFLMVIIKRTRYKHQKRSWGSPPFQIFRKSWNFAPNGRTPKLNIAKGTTDPRVEFCLPK